MADQSPSPETAKINQIASEYENRGYTVFRAGSGFPRFVSELQPDLVATSPTDKVIVEVKEQRFSTIDPKIGAIVDAIKHHPGWRFELVTIDSRDDEPLSLQEAHEVMVHAATLLIQEMNEAALITAWSATEAVLRNLLALEESVENIDAARSPVWIVKTAFSHGLIGREAADVMLAAAEARNGVAHGLRYRGPGSVLTVAAALIRTLEGVFSAIESGDSDRGASASADEMVRWFHENYEDPAGGVPFEGAEGGYIYYLGGPYDPWDALWEKFPDAEPSVIDEAANRIIPEGGEWVRRGQY